MIDFRLQRPAALALLAALLFGASTPLAKLLLGQMSPQLLAGLLYLGSGLGLAALRLFGRLLFPRRAEQLGALHGRDYFWLAGAVACGGVAAPLLLLWGLSGSSAATASLLLNLEGTFSVLLAAWLFRESVAGRVWLASVIMLAGGVLLTFDPANVYHLSPRAGAVILACLLWAADNNLTRQIAHGDPVSIAAIKGLTAGSVNLGLALALGAKLPGLLPLAGSLSLGFFSYGISLVLFIYALRHLGSARAAAHFGTAPFLGAALAVLLLHEPFSALLALALLLMLIATALIVSEQHEHAHRHEALAHSHEHMHDEHHGHAHEAGEPAAPHVHNHEHETMEHSHPHLPDIHHRHGH